MDWPQLFRADTIQQLPKTEQDIDGIMKIIIYTVKKMFLEKNEEVFMIPKKFNYTPVRRDETELVVEE